MLSMNIFIAIHDANFNMFYMKLIWHNHFHDIESLLMEMVKLWWYIISECPFVCLLIYFQNCLGLWCKEMEVLSYSLQIFTINQSNLNCMMPVVPILIPFMKPKSYKKFFYIKKSSNYISELYLCFYLNLMFIPLVDSYLFFFSFRLLHCTMLTIHYHLKKEIILRHTFIALCFFTTLLPPWQTVWWCLERRGFLPRHFVTSVWPILHFGRLRLWNI